MWFNIIPPFVIITAAVGLPGFGLWWIHYFALGNQNLRTGAGSTLLIVTLLTKTLAAYFVERFIIMWYEVLPSFVIITAALGLPGWGLYHIHNLALGNHYRRTLLERWDRAMYQRDERLTGNPYKVNGLEAIPDE